MCQQTFFATDKLALWRAVIEFLSPQLNTIALTRKHSLWTLRVFRVHDVLWQHRVPAFDDGAVGGDAAFTCLVPCSRGCTRSYWGRCKLCLLSSRHATGTFAVILVRDEAFVCAFAIVVLQPSKQGWALCCIPCLCSKAGWRLRQRICMSQRCAAGRWEEWRISVQNCDCGMWVWNRSTDFVP